MAAKDSERPADGFALPGSEGAVELQKQVLDTYRKASEAWLVRVKSEVDFWSDLSARLTASRSVPEAMETYAKSVAQRMQMTADDGRRLLEDSQKVSQQMAQSLSKGWPTGSK